MAIQLKELVTYLVHLAAIVFVVWVFMAVAGCSIPIKGHGEVGITANTEWALFSRASTNVEANYSDVAFKFDPQIQSALVAAWLTGNVDVENQQSIETDTDSTATGETEPP